jgi:hypothetical protein
MVDERGDTVAVNDPAVIQTEEVSDVFVLVLLVAFVFADTRTGVLDDARAFFDVSGGVNAGSVDLGGADDEGHGREFDFLD